jgi:hypothetical protein
MFINGPAESLFEEEDVTKWKRMYSGLALQIYLELTAKEFMMNRLYNFEPI